MATTVRDIITSSMRLIGAVATGEPPQASELVDGLASLNRMLDRWSTESLFVYANVIETFSLVGGQQVYTMGPTGNFDTTRPTMIERAGVATSVDVEIPIEIVNQDQWASITVKNTQSTFPTKLYPVGTFPLETLNVWPMPSASANLVIYSRKPLSSFASINAAFSLPPGYEDAVMYSLALRLAPEYGKVIDQALIIEAMESKEAIRRLNIKPIYMDSDSGGIGSGRRSFNIITGQ